MPDPLSHEWREEEEELRRMEIFAQMAEQHPTWSVAYVRDVRSLLAMVRKLRTTKTDLGEALTQAVSMLEVMDEANEATVMLGWMREALERAGLPSGTKKS